MPTILILLGVQGAGCTAVYFAYKYCNKMYKREEKIKTQIKIQKYYERRGKEFFELLNWEIEIWKEFTMLDVLQKVGRKHSISENDIYKCMTILLENEKLIAIRRNGKTYYRCP